jgi:hypothetical protein
MNRRMAGEDFYFIQKLLPAGGFFNLNQTTVYPSPRSSARVPFGTGVTIQRLTEGKNETLLTLILFSMEHGAVKTKEVHNHAPCNKRLYRPLRLKGIRALFDDLEVRGVGEIIGDDDEAFYRAFGQFKSEVHHHLTDPRIPHEEFDNLMIFEVDD